MSGNRNTTVWDTLAGFGFVAHLGILSGVTTAAWLLMAPIAFAQSSTAGTIASGTAALVCWFGAVLALSISSLLVGPTAAAYALGLSVLARTILPLLLGVALYIQMPRLAAAGLAYYLIVFYLVTLATETFLTLLQVRQPSSGKAA